jgi:tetratricopeptide (TPR) repeat protein
MAFLARLFSKTPTDYLTKGDQLLEACSFFEARNAYEEGLQRYLDAHAAGAEDDTTTAFSTGIARANHFLAEMNIAEAECAIGRGVFAKAAEHLELAKSLTQDATLREKAEQLLTNVAENTNDTNILAPTASACASCSTIGAHTQVSAGCEDPDLSDGDYYDLLIRQLPGGLYDRYVALGEKFAYAYLAASRDDHAAALELLEEWYDGSSRDIYLYEQGMALHRLGSTQEAEERLLAAVADNPANPLPHLGLALLLMEGHRLDEAAQRLDGMIAAGVLPEQAMMLRGDTCRLAGDAEEAIRQYGMLLSTPFARQAAESLHDLLMQCGRHQEAGALFKRYLAGCCH